jgi:hypothetical protein
MGANAVTTTFDFTAGQVLTAAQMDNVNCGVPVFATTVTRDAAFGGTGEKVLAEGQTCYIEGVDEFQTYTGPEWTSITMSGYTAYTPVLTASTTNPTLGTGSSVVGSYQKIGKTINFRVQITFGTSGVNAGSGFYFVSLPPFAANLGTTNEPIANTLIIDNSLGARYIGFGCLNNSTTMFMQMQSNSSGSQASTEALPMAWAASDRITMHGSYEAN